MQHELDELREKLSRDEETHRDYVLRRFWKPAAGETILWQHRALLAAHDLITEKERLLRNAKLRYLRKRRRERIAEIEQFIANVDDRVDELTEEIGALRGEKRRQREKRDRAMAEMEFLLAARKHERNKKQKLY